MRDPELVEARSDLLDGRVDRCVGTVAGDVDGPAGEDVSNPVELHGDAQDPDEVRVLFVARDGAVLQRVPQRGSVTLKHRRVLTEYELGAPNEVEEIVDALRLRLRVAHERGTQAPVLRAWAFSEVDESGQGGGFDVGRHGEQRTNRS